MVKNFWQSFVVTVAILALAAKQCSGSCYFSPELQGTFVTQRANVNNRIEYSQINVTEDSIPIWGICHKRIDNNVILMIASEETMCFRCFNLKLVSRNILRACTTDPDYISKCYTNEEKAMASCPSADNLKDVTRYTEIILYKTYEMDGQEIRREYCPINGRYKLNYNLDDGLDDFMECSTYDSELDNCPSGSAMNLRFKKCTFENHEITFECLGHWEDQNKQKYLALMNSNSSGRDKLGPQYRCAIYKEETVTGRITIYFSKDSTCSVINKSSNNNRADIPHTEVLTMYPAETNRWPHNNFCIFPDWLQGHWQHITVRNDTLIFRDQTSFKAYTMKCVTNGSDDHVLVFSRTQCDEEIYQCVQIKYRSANIVELQIGTKMANNMSETICDAEHFDDSRWLTQGRLDQQYVYSPCPVSGKYTGVIPDAMTLCAKLSSECIFEDIMYYEVSACEYGEVYEERKYRCLGQWTENRTGLVYTYTQRLDIGTYECFVGAINSERKIFIKEAGEHCQRNVNPHRYGMELHKIAHCKQPANPANITMIETTTPLAETSTTTARPQLQYHNSIPPSAPSSSDVTVAPKKDSSSASSSCPPSLHLLATISLSLAVRSLQQ